MHRGVVDRATQAALAERSNAPDWAASNRFLFDVPVTLPLIGTIIHYRGWLKI